jgi:hypothetical protein
MFDSETNQENKKSTGISNKQDYEDKMNTKKQFLTIAALLALFSTPVFAQLSSSPLGKGLYQQMKATAPASYSLELPNSNEMTVAGRTRVTYVSLEQITITGIVGKVDMSARALNRVKKMIDEYNTTASVGSMRFDENTGMVTMQHSVNPKLVKLPAISATVLAFSDALRQQSGRFGDSFARQIR